MEKLKAGKLDFALLENQPLEDELVARDARLQDAS